jgi:FtsP/CotA-like multicopper oxidase with cupredoxin domain
MSTEQNDIRRNNPDDTKGHTNVNESENQQGGLRALVGRRKFLIAGGAGAIAVVGGAGAAAALINAGPDGIPSPRSAQPVGLDPTQNRDLTAVTAAPLGVRYLALAGTDGWASMPSSSNGWHGISQIPIADRDPAQVAADKKSGAEDIDPYFPDPLADPSNRTTYCFSFRNVTGLNQSQVAAQKGRTQLCAPLFFSTVGEEIWITLSNLGLNLRPDLVDSHTLHWHGFRNAIPFYDGVPESSISVPIGRDFTYVYRPKDSGTYMYHCHFEDVEHVTMGMQGIVFVKPSPGDRTGLDADTGFSQKAYGTFDGDLTGESRYHREYAIMVGEIDARAHFNDAHIQATDWTDFHADFWTFNGRAYPDTLEPNGIRMTDSDPNIASPQWSGGDLLAQSWNGTFDTVAGKKVPHLDTVKDATSPAGRLASQPLSSAVWASSGERIVIRFANLGFLNHSIVFPGLDIDVLGRDARFVPTSARRSNTDTIQIGPGESRDVYINIPTGSDGKTFKFYDRGMSHYTGSADGTDAWVGGQMSEIRVVDNLAGQLKPNGWPGEDFWHGERSLEAKHNGPVIDPLNGLFTETKNRQGQVTSRHVELSGTATVDNTNVKGQSLSRLFWKRSDLTPVFTDSGWTEFRWTQDPNDATKFTFDTTINYRANVAKANVQGTYWVIGQDDAGVAGDPTSVTV